MFHLERQVFFPSTCLSPWFPFSFSFFTVSLKNLSLKLALILVTVSTRSKLVCGIISIFFNSFTPWISLGILVTVCHAILMTLVLRICDWINYLYPKWYFSLLSSLFCMMVFGFCKGKVLSWSLMGVYWFSRYVFPLNLAQYVQTLFVARVPIWAWQFSSFCCRRQTMLVRTQLWSILWSTASLKLLFR